MSAADPEQTRLDPRSGSGSEGQSWPSKAKCPDPENGEETAVTGQTGSDEGSAIPGILASFYEEFGHLARRAISVTPGTRLREECVREIRADHRGEGYKSRLLHGVLKAFLKWYSSREGERLVFEGPDGMEVTTEAPNSYSDEYGRKWYGRIKDMERAVVFDAPEPHTTMLSLTASTTDEEGQPRPLGDHLEGLKASWSDHTRKALQRSLEAAGFTERYDPRLHAEDAAVDRDVRAGMAWLYDDEPAGRWWEYLTVVEPHGGGGAATGYAHFHVAVVTSHPVEEADLRPAVDKHVEDLRVLRESLEHSQSLSDALSQRLLRLLADGAEFTEEERREALGEWD